MDTLPSLSLTHTHVHTISHTRCPQNVPWRYDVTSASPSVIPAWSHVTGLHQPTSALRQAEVARLNSNQLRYLKTPSAQELFCPSFWYGRQVAVTRVTYFQGFKKICLRTSYLRRTWLKPFTFLALSDTEGGSLFCLENQLNLFIIFFRPQHHMPTILLTYIVTDFFLTRNEE